jgi:hypothetical protein
MNIDAAGLHKFPPWFFLGDVCDAVLGEVFGSVRRNGGNAGAPDHRSDHR